jgi:Bor protein
VRAALRYSTVLLTLVGALALGCYTMRFEVEGPPRSDNQRVHQRKAFFLWGLAPTREIDAQRICPQGVQAIVEETTFGDGFFSLITLGIYSPRTSVYYCLK